MAQSCRLDETTGPVHMLSTRDPFEPKDTSRTESEGMEKHLSCQWASKESRGAILMSDKLDFKLKTIVRDKEEHYIILKGLSTKKI